MALSGKKLAGIGCGVLVVGAVAAAGGLTWYSTQLSREYKKVKASEGELVAATVAAATWAPPPGGVPDPARVESFAAVREEMSEWRHRLAAEDRAFAGRRGGNWFLRAGDASDLARVMAGFWLARNEALRKAGMGPGEYEWLYGLVYHGWLGHDAAAGRQGSDIGAGKSAARVDDGRFEARRRLWSGGVAPEAAGALEPLRARLEAGWTEETNPVELIFVGEPEPEA
ncbi:MAG: hypothetical protein IPK64_13270 [bacterium]|nr:hypothetical protein [bacterium]